MKWRGIIRDFFFFLLFYGNFWLSSCKSRARKTSVISIHQIFPFQCSTRKWTDRRKPVTTIWSEFLPSVELDIQAKFQKTRWLSTLFFSLRKLISWKLFLFIKFFNAKCKKYSRHFSFIKCRNAYLIFLVELFFTCKRFSFYFITLKMLNSSNIKFWLSDLFELLLCLMVMNTNSFENLVKEKCFYS